MPAVVRRYAVDACVALGWGDSSNTVALLVSEIATNAVLHAYGPALRVVVLDRGMRLRIEVFDGSPGLPVPRRARLGAEQGRGLAIGTLSPSRVASTSELTARSPGSRSDSEHP